MDEYLIALMKRRDRYKQAQAHLRAHDFRKTVGLRQYAEPSSERSPSRKVYSDPTGDLAVGRASKKKSSTL